MSIKIGSVLFLAGLLAGAIAMKKFQLPETVTKEVVRDRVVTVVREVKAPDGTTTTDTTTTADSVKTGTVTKNAIKPNWAVGLTYDTKLDAGAVIEKRLLADLWVSVQATKSQATVGIKYEF